jgi:predicted RNase H-like nuclease (RuvC/YqgF family)
MKIVSREATACLRSALLPSYNIFGYSPSVREFLLKVLMAKDNIEEVLQQTLDAQQADKATIQQLQAGFSKLMTDSQAEVARAKAEAEQLAKEKETAEETVRKSQAEAQKLREQNEQLKKSAKESDDAKKKLEAELDKERKKRKCPIL